MVWYIKSWWGKVSSLSLPSGFPCFSFCSETGSDVIQPSLKVSDGTKDDIELQGCPQLLSGCWVDWTEPPSLVYALLKMELVNPSKQSKGHYPNPLIKISRLYFLLDRTIFLKLGLKSNTIKHRRGEGLFSQKKNGKTQ